MEKRTEYLIQPTVTEKGVAKAWEETILLPTYEIGEEEKNPIFLEKRVYQGSSGVVYPYAVVEKVSDEKVEKPYKALFLENEYLKVMVLPELGGRIQMAYDKTRKRHFVYYNQVIKPALVGLTGPWISGGIEFNWPQHHRPSTYLPTDHCIENNPDGSVTVWCNEVERMFRTKGMQGITLHPGKAYIEIRVKVFNRTDFPQTFLWWANPAVAVNDSYHSVFPSDVHAVFDHGKRDVSTFPIATGVYYKQDYSAGVDISRYKNIPVPTSFMAVQSKYDFVGGYQTDVEAGLLHVANHHVSPGKKQWTWGNGDFGQAWDRNLTDEDGPYIELMTGVYTDNQPDFTWLQPGEEKSWTQYFMPYSEVGYVKNATKEALVNLELKGEKAQIILYLTAEYQDLRVVLKDVRGKVYLDEQINASPSQRYSHTINVGKLLVHELIFTLYSKEGSEMLTYQPDQPEIKPIPDAAKAAEDPKDIASIEQLFLTGQHLEQYRHATYNPADYYLEALQREEGDIRCNNAMGLLLMRKGQFKKAEPFFRKAIATQTERNPNPYDGEPYYNLGLCLKIQGRTEEAYPAFYKATWNAAWQDAGYFALAQIDASRHVLEEALDKVNRALVRNGHHHRARHLKAVLLRYTGQHEAALQWIEDSLEMDAFNMGCRFEKYLLTGEERDHQDFTSLMRGAVHTYIEYALDYASCGFYTESMQLLSGVIKNPDQVYPMVYYALGYFASRSGEDEKALEYHLKAARMCPGKCFPNRVEEILILQDALRVNPSDSYAYYYLGNFWYATRQYEEAVANWQKSVQLNRSFPTVLRNLALALYNKCNKKEEARKLLEEAFALDETDGRLLMELDQLYKKTGVAAEARLRFLENHSALVEQRDDLCLERITLYTQLGDYQKALSLIGSRQFHPWEGGEGKITRQYTICKMQLAKEAMRIGNYQVARELLAETEAYPLNLGEGKLANAVENDINYFKGLVYRGLNQEDEAMRYFRRATLGSSEPTQAFYYNDPQPDTIFYQGLALKALGLADEAKDRFNRLIAHGQKHLSDECKIDYFAVSLPDLAIWEEDLNIRNRIHCNYVIGLGSIGLGEKEKAEYYLLNALELDPNQQDIRLVLNDLSTPYLGL